MTETVLLERVEIVMPVYNGSQWIDDMISSIASQDHENWKLLVRNDGSTDDTQDILEKWHHKLGLRMQILPNPENVNLGMINSLTILLENSTANYVMRADCDDIWHPNKIRVSLSAIKKREGEVNANRAVLVHTDMRVIDARDKEIAASAWSHMGIRPYRNYPLRRLLFHNVVTGPTIIMNRTLIDLALPIPPEAKFEDWWLAMVASAFGEIEPVYAQTMDYRRHGKNDNVEFDTENNGKIQKIKDRSRTILKTLKSPNFMRDRIFDLLETRQHVAKFFLERYGARLDQKSYLILKTFLNLKNLPILERKLAIIRYRLWFPYFIVNIGYLLLI